MRIVVQRVLRASVTIDGTVVAQIQSGVVVLLGVAVHDTVTESERAARKIASLRVFENDEGRLDRSVLDVRGEALVVSQFTLLADSRRQKGTRPDFSRAAPKEVAEPIFDHFARTLRDLGVPTKTGVFGARMEVSLVNDGPVTIVLDA